MDVRLVVEGDPQPLPPGIDLAAYRIAQEGLTNALRHSGASEVTVAVRHRADLLQVEVHDNGGGLRRSGQVLGCSGREGTDSGVTLTATLPTGRPG